MLRMLEMTKLMLKPERSPLLRTPESVGLTYENVAFKATDNVDIRAWFIPRKGTASGARGPVVAFVHGWLWNRTGNVGGKVPFVDRDVDFLPATRALHDAGYHVLLMDVSNHGESGTRFPLTYGPLEARDFIGAVNYLRARPDVDGDRIGAVGCSMGGNIAIYGTPACQPVKAVLAIQPAVLPHFNHNFARTELGPLGPLMVKFTDVLYLLVGAPLPSRHNPAIPARNLGNTIVQYVQGTGDQWGTMEDVEKIAAATPKALPVVKFPSAERYGGYRYISEAVDDVTAFFTTHL